MSVAGSPEDYVDASDEEAEDDRAPGEGAKEAERAERPAGVEEDAILRVLRVPPESSGMRLDRFLSTQLRATSRTRAQAIIDASAFSPDGRRLRASERLRAEQRIYLWRPALDEEAPPEPLGILYEDEHLLVVDKPAHMTVHPTARHHKQTVIKQLEAARPGAHLALIHRLDRETSGVLLIAKSPEAERSFKMALERRSLAAAAAVERGQPSPPADKIYVAITRGTPPEGIIDAPIETDPSPIKVKKCIGPSGLPSRTGVSVLAAAAGYSLVRLELFTGRQHQIRLHLAHVGAPVVGDKLYGGDEGLLVRGADRQLTQDDLETLELPRHALHAYEHRITHEITGQELRVVAPLPRDLADFWRERTGAPLPAGVLVRN